MDNIKLSWNSVWLSWKKKVLIEFIICLKWKRVHLFSGSNKLIPWYKQFSHMCHLSLQNSKGFHYWTNSPHFPAVSGHLGCDWKRLRDFSLVVLRVVKTRIIANGFITGSCSPAAQSSRMVQYSHQQEFNTVPSRRTTTVNKVPSLCFYRGRIIHG